MAERLKIEGNFLVVFEDGNPLNEYINNPLSVTTFDVDTDGSLRFYYDASVLSGLPRNTFLLGGDKSDFDSATIIDDRSGLAFASIAELKSFLRTKLLSPSDGSTEKFYLSRVETIDKGDGPSVEYFSFVQGGTQIDPTLEISGGDYDLIVYSSFSTSSTNGQITINLQVDGVDVFAESLVNEPKDINCVSYYTGSIRIPLLEGVRVFALNLSHSGAGQSTIYEANIKLDKT